MASAAVAVAVDPDFEPSENWDDDFEFNATPGPSSPASSSRTRQPKRSQHDPYQHLAVGSATKSSLAVLPAGMRISLASSEFTMEDWDAESIVHQSPPRVTTSFTTAIIGSGDDEDDDEEFGQTPTKSRAPPRVWGGDNHVGVVFHDPHALPVSLSIALAPWSEEPEMLLPKTPVKAAMALHPAPPPDVEENWDQDFEESDEPTEDAPRRKLSLKARLEEEAHESWDEEFAAEEAEAEARQQAFHQVDLGMGPPPPASRRTPKKSPTAPRRKVSKGKSGIVPSSSSSSASEGEGHPLHHSWRRQKPNRGSKRSSEARYSLSEDGDFYDSSDDEEFGLRRGGMHSGEEEEEDKTVTQRSRKGLGYFKPPKHASPPPPVPKLPDSVFRVPSSPRSPADRRPSSAEVVGPSRSPMLSFSPPPFSNASSPTPFPRSPTSSVFSVPTLAETRSYTSTTHLRPTESRASSGGGTLANLPPSPPIHKDRERRRLRKKSRPSPGSTYEMGSVSGRSRPRKSGESMGACPYSFSDGELEDIRERDRERDFEEGVGERILPRRDDRRTPSPPPQPYASQSGMLGVPGVSVGVSGASDDGHSPPGKQREEGRGGSVPATPKGPGALLSRIGGLTNRWGGRRRRGASGPPNEGDTQATPRPQSSMSSLHLPPAPAQPTNSSPGSAAANPSPNGLHVQPNPSSWFFRSSSNTSAVSAANSRKTGRASLGTRIPSSSTNGDRRMGGDARASLSVTDLPHHDESEYEEYGHPDGGEQGEWEYSYQQEWDALDDRTPVATPSKLVKRKSLGFVQLRRSMIAGREKHKLKVKEREWDGGKESDPAATEKKKKRVSDVFTRTTPSKEVKGDPFVVPFAASTSTSSYASSSPHHHLASTAAAGHSPSKEELPASVGSPSPSGLRSIMGNVRRLSIVSAQAAAAVVTTRHRHKRTQSSSAVAGGSTSPEAVARTSLNAVRDRQAMGQTPIRAMGVLGLRRRESGKEGNGRPLTPSTSVPALQQMYNASDSSRASVYGHGRKRSGTDVDLTSRVDKRGEAEKENPPVATESEASGTESGKGRESGREKEMQVPLSEPMPGPNLLPPIELQPPSPPRKSGEHSRKCEVQPLSLDHPDTHVNEGLESKLGLSTRSPAASSPRTPRKPRDPNSPQSASVGRASPLQPPPPSAFNHKVDPSTSSNSNSSTVKGSKSKDPLVNVVASSSVLRRNSLGDLKIPARISQAQVSLRRDLGMVREFAGAVESLKDLQDTYHALSGDLHVLLERHAQASAAAASQTRSDAPSPPPDDSQSRLPSSSGFFNLANLSRTHLKFKGRKRSNTNPENARGSLSGRNTPYHEESVNPSTTQLPSSSGPGTQTLAASQAAYKELATALYSINSKYRISWECAELLIELGSGTTNADAGPKNNAAVPSPNLVATASASAIALPTVQAIVPQRTASGRERAVTLAGDDRDTSRASTPVSRSSSRVGSYGFSGHAPPIASPLHGAMTASHSTPAVPVSVNGVGMGPPLASPASWRASTGRNDLSQRQLALLRDMLHADGSSQDRPPSSMGRAGAFVMTNPNPNVIGSRNRMSIAEEPRDVSPNREWRWGADAMSSTITLPVTDDEEEGETGTDRTGDKGKAQKPKKKRLMNMSGFRDMLRALRRSTQVQVARPETSKQHHQQDATQGQQILLARSGAAATSTASLSAGSSQDGHSLHSNHQHRHQHPHQRSQQPGQQPQVQRRLIQKRRPKSSAGPEEILAHQQHMQQVQQVQRPPATPPPPPSSFPHPPKSPRRPSLASIFRIGTKSSQQHSSGNATDSNASYMNGSSSSSCLGEDDRRPSYVDEEEDWDQIDTASDLDGMAVSRLDTTIRGGGLGKPQVLEKKMKKRMMVGSGGPPPSVSPNHSEPARTSKRSPYLQQDPYAYRSTSGLGRRIVSASSAPMSSANASSSSVNAIPNANGSQTSLVASGSGRGGKDGPAPPVPPVGDGTGSVRQTKLSDVQENEAGEAATRASASLSRQTAQAFVPPKGPIASPHTSRSVSASSKLTSNKTGSVRSMPPHPFSPSSVSSASGVTSPYTGVSAGGSGGGYPDIKLTFTPENIKPLLENAKEVQKALNECVEELRRLVKREEVRLGLSAGRAVPAQLLLS